MPAQISRILLASTKNKFSTGRLFRDVQMDLFEFLKLNPLSKFKDKDLEGPLKYLKQLASFDKTADLEDHFEAANSSDDESQILGFPTVITRKPYQRYIRFLIRPNGVLHITAPKNRPFALIKKEVSEYKDWLLKRNAEFEVIRKQFPQFFWLDGQPFPFMGEFYKLKLQAAELKKPLVQIDLDQLHYFYPHTWDNLELSEKSKLLKDGLLKFYKSKAIFEMNKRARIWSEHMQLFPKKVTYRNQKTRWGSCSSTGQISFNWKLIAYSPQIMDYIVIHELAHLKHPNHSSRFWSLVEKFCPHYHEIKEELKYKQYEADFLSPESELYLENPKLVNLELTDSLPFEVEALWR